MRRNVAALVFIAVLLFDNPAHAIFGVGDEVFDPQMFARQLQQLQEQTAEVSNLAQQLQYMIKNTTGGGAGVWQSNQGLLTNLGDLISEQQGLSYTVQDVGQRFQQLYPGYNSNSVPAVESPQSSVDTTLNTLNGALASAQAQQIQLLRQLVMAEMNSQNLAAANQINSQSQSNLAAQAELSAPAPASFPDILSAPSAAAPTQP